MELLLELWLEYCRRFRGVPVGIMITCVGVTVGEGYLSAWQAARLESAG